jgi:hypothetical protein
LIFPGIRHETAHSRRTPGGPRRVREESAAARATAAETGQYIAQESASALERQAKAGLAQGRADTPPGVLTDADEVMLELAS